MEFENANNRNAEIRIVDKILHFSLVFSLFFSSNKLQRCHTVAAQQIYHLNLSKLVRRAEMAPMSIFNVLIELMSIETTVRVCLKLKKVTLIILFVSRKLQCSSWVCHRHLFSIPKFHFFVHFLFEFFLIFFYLIRKIEHQSFDLTCRM